MTSNERIIKRIRTSKRPYQQNVPTILRKGHCQDVTSRSKVKVLKMAASVSLKLLSQ